MKYCRKTLSNQSLFSGRALGFDPLSGQTQVTITGSDSSTSCKLNNRQQVFRDDLYIKVWTCHRRSGLLKNPHYSMAKSIGQNLKRWRSRWVKNSPNYTPNNKIRGKGCTSPERPCSSRFFHCHLFCTNQKSHPMTCILQVIHIDSYDIHCILATLHTY